MSSQSAPSTSRAGSLERIATAGREVSTAAVAFHTAVATQQGLSVTEEKVLDLLEREGALTAGHVAEDCGLAPASVTGLVDRLERKGLARRVPHPHDGRRVLIEIDPDRAVKLRPLFTDFLRSMDELYATYNDAELELIAEFLRAAARRQREATARLP